MKNMPTISRKLNTTAAQKEATKVWQRFLNISADGAFGPNTEKATIGYQKLHNLSADGIVGAATWATVPEPGVQPPTPLQQNVAAGNAAASAAEKLRVVAKASAGTPVMPTISRKLNSTPVQKSATVVWQRFLKVNADGIFGSGTEKATIAYQKARGLKADGIVGPATWATVANLATLAALAPKPVAPAVKPPTPKPQPTQSVFTLPTNVPRPVQAVTGAIDSAASSAASAVNQAAAATKEKINQAGTAALQAVVVYKKQPFWIQALTAAAVSIGSIATFKALIPSKRKATA